MKNSFKQTAIATCLVLTGLWSCAQVPPSPTPPGAPAPGLMPPPPPGPVGAPGARLQQLMPVSGKITAYLANDRYEYDGFTLQGTDQTVTVKFPAHLGEQLMKTVKPGTAVTVNGYYETSPLGANEFHLVNVQAGTTLITDAPPVAPVTPPAEEMKTISGTISDFRRGPDGSINGVLLSGKEVVDLPPAAAQQLQTLLTTGQKLSVTGIKATPPQGVVVAENRQLIRPQTITISGQTYMVR